MFWRNIDISRERFQPLAAFIFFPHQCHPRLTAAVWITSLLRLMSKPLGSSQFSSACKASLGTTRLCPNALAAEMQMHQLPSHPKRGPRRKASQEARNQSPASTRRWVVKDHPRHQASPCVSQFGIRRPTRSKPSPKKPCVSRIRNLPLQKSSPRHFRQHLHQTLSSPWPETLEAQKINKCICNSSTGWDTRQLFIFPVEELPLNQKKNKLLP